ncbi:uncharacterized protein LOC121718809 [Alosa sapidissima]|uniref:uncharacterized protein LOC121718809 n=1 Tax=Alosa sapidissima TaxID=34773 RepID=UPI001C08BEB4|nr:uncharacterized protein LOC121718809 [Alosa sapidissima]
MEVEELGGSRDIQGNMITNHNYHEQQTLADMPTHRDVKTETDFTETSIVASTAMADMMEEEEEEVVCTAVEIEVTLEEEPDQNDCTEGGVLEHSDGTLQNKRRRDGEARRPSKARPHNCAGCESSGQQRGHQKHHRKQQNNNDKTVGVHHGEETGVEGGCICDHCGEVFISTTTLNSHVISTHTADKPGDHSSQPSSNPEKSSELNSELSRLFEMLSGSRDLEETSEGFNESNTVELQAAAECLHRESGGQDSADSYVQRDSGKKDNTVSDEDSILSAEDAFDPDFEMKPIESDDSQDSDWEPEVRTPKKRARSATFTVGDPHGGADWQQSYGSRGRPSKRVKRQEGSPPGSTQKKTAQKDTLKCVVKHRRGRPPGSTQKKTAQKYSVKRQKGPPPGSTKKKTAQKDTLKCVAKHRRGRPPGSTQKKTAQKDALKCVVKHRRGRPPGSTQKKTTQKCARTHQKGRATKKKSAGQDTQEDARNCAQCGEVFSASVDLENHMLTHDAEEPQDGNPTDRSPDRSSRQEESIEGLKERDGDENDYTDEESIASCAESLDEEELLVEGRDPDSESESEESDWEPVAEPPRKQVISHDDPDSSLTQAEEEESGGPAPSRRPATHRKKAKSSVDHPTPDPGVTQEEESPRVLTPSRRPAARGRGGRGASAGSRRGGRGASAGSGRGRGRRAEPTARPAFASDAWKGMDQEDVVPCQPTFNPTRTPGPQLSAGRVYAAVELFQLFITDAMLQTVVKNTNRYGRRQQESGAKQAEWQDITLRDMYSYLSMLVYMGLVKGKNLTDYWRRSELYRIAFPLTVMSGRKFQAISTAIHMSDPASDAANDIRRGTPGYDRLGRIKPMYDELRAACRASYHPRQNISVDERMVASRAKSCLVQHMQNKPTRWGYKLFVLADSSNGYTWDFFVYEGRGPGRTEKGLSYDAVMSLLPITPPFLGSGYKLFLDNFFTSPDLFRDLLQNRSVWACGTARAGRLGALCKKAGMLDKASPKGTIRWHREGPLVLVQWRDSRDVILCSTFHTAHSDAKVTRKVRSSKCKISTIYVPIPPAVLDYNKSMGGVDLSDALISYYNVLHKTKRWYRSLFYHFVDIGIVNAFILHKEQAATRGERPLVQKAFRELLVRELKAIGSPTTVQAPARPDVLHRPSFYGTNSTECRRRCKRCSQKTGVYCSHCRETLCLTQNRNCFVDWHASKNM